MKEETTPTAGLHNPYDKETTQLQANEAVLFERANNGNNLKPFDYFVAGCKFEASTTPVPLSEQKQEEETVTVEEFINQCYEHYLPLSECLNMLSDGDLNTHDCLGSLSATMKAYASQYTAKQIDQYKARIVALESEILTLKNK